MTGQIPDTIIWKRKEYDLLGYEGEEEELFTPEQFGMNPKSINTACWRGFNCEYKIVRNFLYLDTVSITDENDYYPPINGVKATVSPCEGYYSDLSYPVKYTGTLRIGKDFHLEHYVHMGFQKPSAYGVVWDLTLNEGKVTEKKDISEEVKKIEGQYHNEYPDRDIIDRIDDSFKRDLQLK